MFKSGQVKPEAYLGQDKPAVYNSDNVEIVRETVIRGSKSCGAPKPSAAAMERVEAFVKSMDRFVSEGIIRILNDGHVDAVHSEFSKMIQEATGRN